MLKVRNYILYIAYNMVKFLVEMAKQSKAQSPDIVRSLFFYKEKESFFDFLLIKDVIKMVPFDWRDLIMQVEEEPYLQVIN